MISVIIPVYNGERYLEDCLFSVVRQTYTDWEILLADDGSTDASPQIGSRFARDDARIRFLARPHRGVSAARNAALCAAQGEYVFFLDGDDELHPLGLETLYQQLRSQEAKFAFCGFQRTPFAKCGVPVKPRAPKTAFFDSREMIEQFCRNQTIFGGIGGKLIARDAIGALRFDTSLSLGEDTLFLYELLRKGISGAYTEESLYYYRAEGGSWSALRRTAKGMRDIGRVRQRIEQGEEECGRTDHARIWAGEYLSMIKYAMNHLPARELERWREDVAREQKSPYFRERPWRTKGAVWLAFFCHPLYRAIKTSYRFLKRGEREQDDEEV